MNIEYLQYFKALAEKKHYASTADALIISQSTLSYAIHKIEMELGVALFEKKGRGIELTPFGVSFYDTACSILQQYEAGKSALNKLKTPTERIVTLGFTQYISASGFMPRLLWDFSCQKGNSGIKLHVVPYLSMSQLINSVYSGDLDCAIAMKTQRLPNITSTMVHRRYIRVVAAKDSPFAQMRVVRPNDICQCTLISEKIPDLHSGLVQYFRNLNPNLQTIFAHDRYDVLSRVANEEGLGLMADASNAGEYGLVSIPLIDIPLADIGVDIDYYFIRLSDLTDPGAKMFTDFVEKNYALDK